MEKRQTFSWFGCLAAKLRPSLGGGACWESFSDLLVVGVGVPDHRPKQPRDVYPDETVLVTTFHEGWVSSTPGLGFLAE